MFYYADSVLREPCLPPGSKHDESEPVLLCKKKCFKFVLLTVQPLVWTAPLEIWKCGAWEDAQFHREGSCPPAPPDCCVRQRRGRERTFLFRGLPAAADRCSTRSVRASTQHPVSRSPRPSCSLAVMCNFETGGGGGVCRTSCLPPLSVSRKTYACSLFPGEGFLRSC